jgi:hypothetical protein
MVTMHNPAANQDLPRGFADPERKSTPPVPLVGENIEVVVRAGLALVKRRQLFRNIEGSPIEATITFPVPVHATLHKLTARIAGRLLTGTAQPREQARADYEKAIDEGKTTVLHEERARGIHMLSVGNVPAGAEIEVTHAWIAALSLDAGRANLRLPVTVGDVYGVSPFSDADDLVVSGDVVHEAEIAIDAGDVKASVAGLAEGATKGRLVLDRPIDIVLDRIGSGQAEGRAADGRSVSITIAPERGEADMNVAVLIDRSGSMSSPFAWTERAEARITKHAAVVQGLKAWAGSLRAGDKMELWQFDDVAERVSGPGTNPRLAVAALAAPRGGTEIGAALGAVVGGAQVADVVMITDGLSHALDVQALANSGRRFSVILVGEDSLEANVGHLAALSGGQLVVVSRADGVAEAIAAVIAAVRRPRAPHAIRTWPLERAELHAGGALIEARWHDVARTEPAAEAEFASAVGAFAAAMALPSLAHDTAVKVAAEHGLVCHLTSLVLVDEAGARQETLPVQRKVALMQARGPVLCAPPVAEMRESVASLGHAFEDLSASAPAFRPASRAPKAPSPGSDTTARSRGPRLPTLKMPTMFQRKRRVDIPLTLADAAKRIDWHGDPDALMAGNLSRLPPVVAELIRAASKHFRVLALVGEGRVPHSVVIALLARSVAAENPAADRIARAILKGVEERVIATAMQALGLTK